MDVGYVPGARNHAHEKRLAGDVQGSGGPLCTRIPGITGAPGVIQYVNGGFPPIAVNPTVSWPTLA